MKRFLLILWLGLCGFAAAAQEPASASQGVPDDVYYLMPSFADGVVYFRGQAPARGRLNICALDHSLRFMDKDGKELAASNVENILKVQIDTVSFLRWLEFYYRQYPVTADMGVALYREVRIKTDAKQGAFGTTSQTSAITNRSTFYVDGALYNLEGNRDFPYEINEQVALYKGIAVFPLNKKNLRKLFPEKKEQIDAWFKAGNPLPTTVPAALSLLRQFAL